MFTHTTLHKALLTAFVLSVSSLASAHNFPKPQTKAEIAAERAAKCKAAEKARATGKRTVYRFGPPSAVTTASSYRVVGTHRFGGGKYVPPVACTRPMKSHVACL